MPESVRRPDGSFERAVPLPEPFGITWERCWRERHRSGQNVTRAYVCGWLDARALRRLTSTEAAR